MQKIAFNETKKLNFEGFTVIAYYLMTEECFTVAFIDVFGAHPLKKMLGDTTRTYTILNGEGEFIINGYKHKAAKGDLFVIQPNNTYEYSGEMHMMEYTVSPSKTFSSEFVNPPKAVADYSGRAGKALVYTSEETYLLDIRNMLEPEVAGNTHIGMWMPDLGDIVRNVDANEYPFLGIYERILAAYLVDATKEAMVWGGVWQKREEKYQLEIFFVNAPGGGDEKDNEASSGETYETHYVLPCEVKEDAFRIMKMTGFEKTAETNEYVCWYSKNHPNFKSRESVKFA